MNNDHRNTDRQQQTLRHNKSSRVLSILLLVLRHDNTVIISPAKTLNSVEVEEEKLKVLVSVLEKAGIRKYTCINKFGYSQIERDIVDLLTAKTYTRDQVFEAFEQYLQFLVDPTSDKSITGTQWLENHLNSLQK